MKIIRKTSLLAGTILLSAASLLAQPFGQWDFNSSDLTATVGPNPLEYLDGIGGATEAQDAFGTTTSFGIPNIGGSPATVMFYPSNTTPMGYKMIVPASGNGGGTLVNDWSILYDVLYPASSSGKFRSFIEIDNRVTADSDFFVNPAGGIGISGQYNGLIQPNTWHRVAFVVKQSANTIFKYIDGVQVGTQTAGGVDGRWALIAGAFAELFNDNDGDTQPGYVNSIQLYDSALTAGQIEALGVATAAGLPTTIPTVPSFISSRSPGLNAVNVAPTPAISIVLDQGGRVVTSASIVLALDGTDVAAIVGPLVGNTYTITYNVPTPLSRNSAHTLALRWSDNTPVNKTIAWAFTVGNYQLVENLPNAFYQETFESLAESALPAGWSVTNNTGFEVAGFDLCTAKSEAYEDFVVIDSALRLAGGICSIEGDVFNFPPIVINTTNLDAIVHGKLAFALSDNRADGLNQVEVMYTHDIDCTTRSNVYLSFHSIWKQNQDNFGSVEYSVDMGATWLPLAYYMDDENQVADVIRVNGVIDATASLTTARDDQPNGGAAFNQFILAPVASVLSRQIQGKINDNGTIDKKVELLRLTAADFAPKVRFRFGQAGRCSWYFGVDDVFLHEINAPVILEQPVSISRNGGQNGTFTVVLNAVAAGTPAFSFQWKKNGVNLSNGGHYSGVTTATLTVSSINSADAAAYSVAVSNTAGTANSDSATLTVIDTPVFSAHPQSATVNPGVSVVFRTQVAGTPPLTLRWYKGASLISGQSGQNYAILGTVVGDEGAYSLVASNASGSVTSLVANLKVVTLITRDLVAHMKFDGDYLDSSGRGNDASPVGAPSVAVAGKIGSAFQFTTAQDGSSFNYATFGYPADLKFTDSTDFSISMWIKLPPGSWLGDPALFSNKNWGAGANCGFALFTSGGRARWNYCEVLPNTRKDSGSGIMPANTIADGSWHHFVVTFKRGGNAASYLDGTLRQAQSILGPGTLPTNVDNDPPNAQSATANAVNIGQDGTGAYTDGNAVGITNACIDDLGVWQRTLTPAEVVAIYNAGNSGFTLNTAVVTDPTPLDLTAVAGSVIVTRPPGTLLESAPAVTGPWTIVGGSSQGGAQIPNPFTTNAVSGPTFYRTRQP